MSSRSLQLIVTMAATFLILFVFGVSCGSSYGQAGRAARRGGAGRATQENVRDTYRQLLEKMQKEGYDVSEAQALGDRARLAMREGNRQEAQKLLTEAIEKLKALESRSPDRPQTSGESKTGKTARIELSVGSSQVQVTQSVPSAASGDKVESYQGAFKSETLTAKNGKVSLELTTTPVFIEETGGAASKTSGNVQPPTFGIALNGFLNRDPAPAVAAMKDLGAEYARFYGPPGGLIWDLVEPSKGAYSWSRTDKLYLMAHQSGLPVMTNVYTINTWDHPEIQKSTVGKSGFSRMSSKYPNAIDSYLAFVRASAERYDGDGKNDAPGSPKVKWWIVGCEMESPTRWLDSPEKLGQLFVETYGAVKESYPEATVMLFGTNLEISQSVEGTIDRFHKVVLQEIKKRSEAIPGFSFVFALHHYSPDPSVLLDNIKFGRNLLDEAGFKDVPVWVDDCATFAIGSGRGVARSERQLAEDVIRLYSVGLAHGMEKFVWANISDSLTADRHTSESGFIGVLQSGRKTTYKKLSYYTYKLMTEKLRGANFKAVQVLHEGENGAYLYGFENKYGKRTYVGWMDSDDSAME